uniref:Uncharacterized protein n=1 Tax=Leersia perrieri TaxID=77586 RepID=A0A0D9WFB1_9ORYZ
MPLVTRWKFVMVPTLSSSPMQDDCFIQMWIVDKFVLQHASVHSRYHRLATGRWPIFYLDATGPDVIRPVPKWTTDLLNASLDGQLAPDRISTLAGLE